MLWAPPVLCRGKMGLANNGELPLFSHKEVVVLALCFKDRDFAFVYHDGEPIGAIFVGEISPRARSPKVSLLFSGRKSQFEVLRPSVVERRYGREELERLTELFLGACDKPPMPALAASEPAT